MHQVQLQPQAARPQVATHWRHKASHFFRRGAFYAVAAFMLLGLALHAQAAAPDLTQSQNVDRSNTYNLGPTGARGWIYATDGGGHDAITDQSRQILITTVGANTPAAGVLQVNDVILGLGVGTGVVSPFASDARKSLGMAIGEAEKTANNGALKLRRWRAGATSDVTLQLPLMGSYSDTAPFNCPKSAKILANACAALAKEDVGNTQGLGLLACGDANSMARAQTYARQRAPQDLRLNPDGMVVWDWGYTNLFLTEYYLRTHDSSVLPAINVYTVSLAKGQSLFGTYGHGIADLGADGGLHGSIGAYGPVNSAGLVANVSLVLGKKAGVVHTELDPAIERATNYFSYYVNKGGVPYGEHEPYATHGSNGKDAMAAVLFGLQGNQIAQSQYFARMSVAGYDGREHGHTGPGFSYLWSALGTNVGGPAAATAYFKQVQWHLDLARRSDGSFVYDGSDGYGGGATEGGTYLGKTSYYGFSPTASHILAYALPLKSLYITGKDANAAQWLSAEAVADAMAAGRFFLDSKAMSVTQLIDALNRFDPVVRSDAAEELGKRTLSTAQISQLMTMAEGSSPVAREAACHALGALRNTSALPALGRRLTDPDPWVRTQAARALKNFGGAAMPQLATMLAAAASTAKPAVPIDWSDPVQIAHGQLGDALFKGLISGSLDGIDRNLLYPAIRAVSRNADGMARSTLEWTLAEKLSLDDVKALAPDIIAAIATKAPADTMFADYIRASGLRALAKYYVAEGIPLATMLLTEDGWGDGERRPPAMDALARYRGAAKSELPTLRSEVPRWGTSAFVPQLQQTISIIENDQNPPPLINITSPGPFTITASAGANGSISPAGSVSVAKGSAKTFAITPAASFVVAAVTVDGASVGAVTSYTFSNVQSGHSISASFKSGNTPGSFTITASAGANGAISPSGSVTVAQGASKTFAITPAANYVIDAVMVDGAAVGATSSITFSSVQSAHSISASFKAGTAGGGPAGYTKCADEYRTCTLSGTNDLAYGANGKFNYRAGVVGNVACSNATFGDPLVGVVKACYYKKSGVTPPPPPPPPPPGPNIGKLRVFILAGQSNMQGYGKVDLGGNPNTSSREPNILAGLGSLRAMVMKNPSAYSYLLDSSKTVTYTEPSNTSVTKTYPAWATRSDVWVSDWDGDPTTQIRNGALTVGFGAGNEMPEGYIGPELAFGHIVGNALNDKMLLIKTSWGGKSLAVDFRPPSSGQTGPYYTEMINKVRLVLSSLKTYYPAYDGAGYEIAGFGWHQGWNDRVNDSYIAQYETNLANLIRDVRKDLGAPKMLFVIANTGMADANLDASAVRLITAQGNVSDPKLHPEFAGTVSTVDTRPFDYGVNSPAPGFGYHWNYNGESYFRIGEGMGNAMLKLMTPSMAAKKR